MLCALIMAGGKGTRFWPLSTEEKPKQFLKLVGKETMIQLTFNRIKSIIPIERIFVCTAQIYIGLVKQQLPEILEKNIIIEPYGKNTAACIALSALVIQRYYKNLNMIVLPSDHLINDEDKFRSIVQASDEFICKNREAIITLGMNPKRPETGYGYVKFGKEKHFICGHEVRNVECFVEKPSIQKAKDYIKKGSYLWNGGMFIWSINNILNQIKRHCENIYEVLHQVEYIKEDELQDLISKIYINVPAISIDYAVLEKADNIYVIPANIGWDDVGTWRSIERYRDKDVNNNIINENVKVIESKYNAVINNEKRVVIIGLRNIMTVETEDSIFIVNKNYMDNLRDYKGSLQ